MSIFTPDQEAYIAHEVQIRSNTGEIRNLREDFIRLEEKMDSHFKWILGTNITLFASVILPVIVGVILHLAKLI